ncbi:MAG: DUF1761 domain-containing protein [Chloroflexi bacterium]|nr:MAG: DUF1761 domain-containing protein [Chloroflexota bacterium]
MSFAYPHINLIALLLAALAQFVIGFLWYSQMTPIGRMWMAEMHFGDREAQPGAEMLIFPVSSIFVAWSTSMVIAWSGASGSAHGMLAAWVVALAVGMQTIASGVASGKSSSTLMAINVGYLAFGYGVMGAIIGAFA